MNGRPRIIEDLDAAAEMARFYALPGVVRTIKRAIKHIQRLEALPDDMRPIAGRARVGSADPDS